MAKKTKAKGKSGEKKVSKGFVFTTGKRKRAIARARFKPGSGLIRINSQPLELISNEMVRLKIQEPLILTGDAWKKYNVKINVRGGGLLGQAEAVRQAIAKGLVELLGSETKKMFLSYDRNLLVYDPRRTEPHKPPRSSQGPRRAKQKSKR